MDIAIIIGLLVFGGLGLNFGADWLVRGSSNVALSFGIKPLVIGLTLVAFGTSAPELTVSAAAALSGGTDISVGNVVGSNIANLGLVLGISALVRPIKVDADVFRRDFPAMLAASILIALLPFLGGSAGDGEFLLDRWKGGVLLLGMAIFLFLMFRNVRSGNVASNGEASAPDGAKKFRRGRSVMLAVLGLVVLLAGGQLFVEGAVRAAKMLGISELVIGLTVVAVGTSLPEMATSLIASARGESDISIGNVVGSNIFNLLFVLGVVSLILPLPIAVQVVRTDIPFMVGITLIAVVLARLRRRMGRPEGAVLLGLYVAYVANLVGGWI